ncbi:hypothetical protein OIY81_372 [Cryptosporidium canis]|uniref:DUF4378 domain-containing protein n=1 Tax=Cryptosporidium canis TaxID=195482 RepID=A0ABQ8P840_9CRYT|nr:hypothetical protein OJ252_1432 [Cryptosporidium canis]KAJ1614649.1 hypothetical protein OIY81_372 [Cryptosporidium canis]
MFDKISLIGTSRRGSGLDSFLDSRKNQSWRPNQSNMGFNTRVERPARLVERESRTQERLRRLSACIRSRENSPEESNGFSQSDVQIEHILLYINTGAKYNRNIYERREEYARMIHEIVSVGGNCSDIMISSFKNIAHNHKVNNVNMTRMDRLLNFLSFVQDLHKNYCDPSIVRVIPNDKSKRGALKLDIRSKSLPTQNIIHSYSSNERFKDSYTNKTVRSNQLKIMLEKYKFERENKRLLNSKPPQDIRDLIRNQRLKELRNEYSSSIKMPNKGLNRSISDETSVRKIFESLQRSRKKYENSKEMLPTSSMVLKDSAPKISHSKVKSENFLKFKRAAVNLEKSEDQRIQGLKKLINQLKDIKLRASINGVETTNYPRNDLELYQESTTFTKEKEPNPTPTFETLKHENLVQTQMEFLNILKRGNEHENNFPNKIDENGPTKVLRKEKNRWELDTPYINYRKICPDTYWCPGDRKMRGTEQNGIDCCGDHQIEQKSTPEIPVINNIYSEWSESSPDFTQDKSESTLIPQQKSGSDEKNTNLGMPLMLLDKSDKEALLDNYEAHKYVNLSSEQTLESKDILQRYSVNTNNAIVESTTPAYTHSPSIKCINESLETPSEVRTASANSTEIEQSTFDKITSNIAPIEWVESISDCNLEDSPLEPIQIFKHEESVEDINDLANKLEDITILNECLIKKIENLPIENISGQNNNLLSALDPHNEKSGKNSQLEEPTYIDRISSIEYFTAVDEELRSKIEEYRYWFESVNSANYYELGLDGLNLDEFYYKNLDSVPKCYDELIDMSANSVNNICNIICNKLPKVIVEQMKSTGKDICGDNYRIGIEILNNHELCEEDLLSFVHEQVMKDPKYTEYKSSMRKEICPPDDNFIMLIIDLIQEFIEKWQNDQSFVRKVPITSDLISKHVIDMLCNSYEPYLSEIDPEEWTLKKVFHAPNYPNILESEKELLNIEHLFKYHSCEDMITSEHISVERQQWLKISNYYLPLLKEVVEQVLHEIIDHLILELKVHN